MPKYLHPGAYIEGIERGPRPIEGVPTSTAAFLGETDRGPTKPRLVTGYNQFERWFGGPFDPSKFLPQAVSGFFGNGGTAVYICRILGNGATPAWHNFGDLHVEAAGPGDWGKWMFVAVSDSTTKRPDPKNPQNPPKRVGIRVQAAYWATPPANFAPFNAFQDLTTLPRPAYTEDFDDLSLDDSSPDYFGKRVNGNSAHVVSTQAAA